MKQLVRVLVTKLQFLPQQTLKKVYTVFRSNVTKRETEKDFCGESNTQSDKQPEQNFNKSIIIKIAQRLLLAHQQRVAKSAPFKKASLFVDGKTSVAALSLVLRGVAEVLSQKMDLPWKGDNSTLSYEKQVSKRKGKICYYVTDNPENPHPETLAGEAALAVIDSFDPRAGAIHLIYCAQVANLEKPWEDNFILDDRQLVEYTGLVKRRDLCRQEQLDILYNLLRQPAQILASIAWPKQGKVGAFTVAELKVWDITVLRDFDTDKAGNTKLTGLRVIGKPGEWTKYFLNKSDYHRHTGIITKKTVQKLFSIGKQNAGAARLLIWLTFQIQPGIQDCLTGKTLFEVAYGADKMAVAQHDRQLRRQLADDFATDLKALKEAGWQVELETGPAWLVENNRTKRPIGFWSELLDTQWRFHLPVEAIDSLSLSHQPRTVNMHVPAGTAVRKARIAKGWSRAFLAAAMGKSISWVDAVETGHRNVSQKDLPKLVDKLGLNEMK